MDPSNRRELWDLINLFKRNSAVVLTTHSLEEADLLSDKIGIMAHGKIRCLGNALHLKNKFGSGYKVTVIVTTNELVQQIQQNTVSLFDNVIFTNQDYSTIFNIPQTKKNIEIMTKYIHLLEQMAIDGNIREWGISHSSLEDVFLTVTHNHSNTISTSLVPVVENDNNKIVNTSMMSDPIISNHEKISIFDEEKDIKTHKTFPFRALMRKNFSVQRRQKCTNFWQIITPIVAVLFLFLTQQMIHSELGVITAEKHLISPVCICNYSLFHSHFFLRFHGHLMQIHIPIFHLVIGKKQKQSHLEMVISIN